MNDVKSGNLDQSYDHLIKGDQNKEESKNREIDDNEELKEGFIGDLYKTVHKEKMDKDQSNQFNMNEASNDRSRAKTAFMVAAMGSTLGELNKLDDKPNMPMINNI